MHLISSWPCMQRNFNCVCRYLLMEGKSTRLKINIFSTLFFKLKIPFFQNHILFTPYLELFLWCFVFSFVLNPPLLSKQIQSSASREVKHVVWIFKISFLFPIFITPSPLSSSSVIYQYIQRKVKEKLVNLPGTLSPPALQKRDYWLYWKDLTRVIYLNTWNLVSTRWKNSCVHWKDYTRVIYLNTWNLASTRWKASVYIEKIRHESSI